jgi:hypothetical protein
VKELECFPHQLTPRKGYLSSLIFSLHEWESDKKGIKYLILIRNLEWRWKKCSIKNKENGRVITLKLCDRWYLH